MGRHLRHVGYHVHGLRIDAAARDYAGPRQLVIPILQSVPGREYLLVPGHRRVFGIPYDVATAPRLGEAAPGNHDGYIPLKQARRQGLESGLEYLLRSLRQAAGARPRSGHPGTGRGADRGAAGNASPGQQVPAAVAALRPRRPRSLTPEQRSMVSGALASLAAGGGLQIYELAGSLGLQCVGAELREVLGDVLGLGAVDDTSSSADWLQETAVGMAADAITGEVIGAVMSLVQSGGGGPGLLEQVKTQLLGETSTASLGAVTTGHPDDQGNTAIGDAGLQVLVEGMALAPALHGMAFVAPKMAAIVDGSTTVLAGSSWVARCTSATAVPSTMVVGAPSVLVGGDGLCQAAIQAGQVALQNGVPLGNVKPRVVAAQNAYSAAKRAGYSDEVAEAAAASAAMRPEVSAETSATLLNVFYSESKARRGNGDARGATQVAQGDGYRVFSVGADGAKGEEVDFRVGDVLRLDATGEEFRVQKVVQEAGTFGEFAAYQVVDVNNPQRAVLILSGTDDTADWATNLLQGLGLVPEQYRRAAELAEEFRQQNPGGTILGHSLGGGLAAYAGLMTGMHTQIFNPAGLGDGTLNHVYASGVNVAMADITTHIVDGELLDAMQWLGVSPPSAGEVHRYPGNPRPFQLPVPVLDEVLAWFTHGVVEHKMPAVLNAMQNHGPIEIEVVPFRTPG